MTLSDEDLKIQGDLTETTVPDLFRSIVRSSETATLALDSGGRSDVIYFHDGRMIFASSTDPDMGLAETLLRGGELNLQQYRAAMERVVVSRRVAGLLVELGYLKPDELSRAVERQASAIVLNAIGYRSGNYTIDFTTGFPDGIIALQLSTERLILDGIHRIDYWSLVERGIGRLNRLLEQVPGADTRSYQVELNEEESHVLSLLSIPQTVEQLCARSYLTNFATCRTAWGLLAVNFLQDAASDGVHEKRAAEESEYELEEMVEHYNAVYQQIFAAVFQQIGDHVYDFLDRVILHVKPETLSYLSGMTLVNEGRVDFDQFLNNLIAAEPDDRGMLVRSILDQLLYGWIEEGRSEFGQPLETKILKIAEGLRE